MEKPLANLSDRDVYEESQFHPLEVYEGERNENDERHGRGRALLPNGDMYDGQYRNGLRHGEGIYVFKNAARYNGNWRNGCKHGQGTFWYPDGTRYEGEWKDNTKHGFGIYFYANGDVYEGSWKEDLRHGTGTYIYANTDTIFMGMWMEDCMQGPGQLIHARHRFHGFWKFNLPYGRGCFVFENVSMQHGHYIHPRHPARYDSIETRMDEDVEKEDKEHSEKSTIIEGSVSLKILPVWRARCITSYNPELLPPSTVSMQEEGGLWRSLGNYKCYSSNVLYVKYKIQDTKIIQERYILEFSKNQSKNFKIRGLFTENSQIEIKNQMRDKV